MILCDLCDIKGDSRTGIKSLHGARSTIFTLAGLLAIIVILSMAAVRQSAPGNITAWKSLGAGITPYLAALLVIARRMRPLPEFFL
jgi:hypothetical protein